MKNWSWVHYCRKQSSFIFLQATLSLSWHKRGLFFTPHIQTALQQWMLCLHTSCTNCSLEAWPKPRNFTSTAPNSEIHLQSFVHSVSVPVPACEHQLNNQIQAMWELFTRAFSSTSLEGMKTHLKIWTPQTFFNYFYFSGNRSRMTVSVVF